MPGHYCDRDQKALLWHTVEIRTRSHVETLSCLGEEVASRLANDLHRFINCYLLELIGSDQEALKEVDAKLEPLIDGKRQYLAQADLAQAIASVSGPAAEALSHPLFDADGIPRSQSERELMLEIRRAKPPIIRRPGSKVMSGMSNTP